MWSIGVPTKRSTDKAVFQHFAQFELVEQPGSGELMFFVLTDRQTDGQTDNKCNQSLYRAHVRGVIASKDSCMKRLCFQGASVGQGLPT